MLSNELRIVGKRSQLGNGHELPPKAANPFPDRWHKYAVRTCVRYVRTCLGPAASQGDN